MTWNPAVPAGTDLVSEGDDVIREMKLDIQTALTATEGAPLNQDGGVFPGDDPANPLYHYRGLKGSTADRPTPENYGLYFNTDTNTIQRSNGTIWEDIVASGFTPGTSTDNALARFDGVNGALQNSGVILDDANNMSGINDLDVIDDVTIGGTTTMNGPVVITGTSGHSVTEEFAFECWVEHDRPAGTSVGIGGIAISAESGTVSETTDTPQDIGVTATLDTKGNPVFVGLTCDESSGSISFRDPAPYAANSGGVVQLRRDNTVIYQTSFLAAEPAAGSKVADYPPSCFWFIDNVAAGNNYDYDCTIATNAAGSGSSSITAQDVMVIAFEL